MQKRAFVPFAEIIQGLPLFQKLIDVVVGINRKISKYPFEKQNLSKFLKKSMKSNISQLLLLFIQYHLFAKSKEEKIKPGLFWKWFVQDYFKNKKRFTLMKTKSIRENWSDPFKTWKLKPENYLLEKVPRNLLNSRKKLTSAIKCGSFYFILFS